MSHWLTQYDEDGDPYGIVCGCDVGADHWLSGALMFPDGPREDIADAADEDEPTTVDDIEDGDWIVFDGEKLKVYEAGSPFRGTRVLTLEGGQEIELPVTDPIKILPPEPFLSPSTDGGKN